MSTIWLFRAFVILWGGWGLSWLAASFWAAAPEAVAGAGAGLPYRIMTWVGGALFAVPAHRTAAVLRLWHVGWDGAWLCLALTAAGIAFAWWARLHLGRLWSAAVTRKAGHRVVDTGPYAIVRHPIYTGLLLALFATMAAKGTALGLAGAGLAGIGIWLKARLEERFLRAELGPEAYDAYAARVPMLLPRLR